MTKSYRNHTLVYCRFASEEPDEPGNSCCRYALPTLQKMQKRNIAIPLLHYIFMVLFRRLSIRFPLIGICPLMTAGCSQALFRRCYFHFSPPVLLLAFISAICSFRVPAAMPYCFYPVRIYSPLRQLRFYCFCAVKRQYIVE